jgi:isopentenyl phosphate kinase
MLTAASAQIRAASAALPERLIVAHGSGSFAHVAASDSGFATSPTSMATAHVAAAARRLNSIVVEALIAAELPALGLPGAALVRQPGRSCTIRTDVVTAALDAGLLPVIYGDAVPDGRNQGTICNTEALIGGIARSLGAERIVLATDVDGVLAPGSERAPPIAFLTPAEATALAPRLGTAAPGAVDVTGGMSEKVRAMAQLVADLPDLEVWIVNGTVPGRLLEALTATPGVGTRIAMAKRS